MPRRQYFSYTIVLNNLMIKTFTQLSNYLWTPKTEYGEIESECVDCESGSTCPMNDWPSTDDFANIATNINRPDLGPKMCNAYGSALHYNMYNGNFEILDEILEDKREEAYRKLIGMLLDKSEVLTSCIGNLSGYKYYIKSKWSAQCRYIGVDKFTKME
ncbi:7217_t:CDS:2, partial [Dentiscutata erythropus]